MRINRIVASTALLAALALAGCSTAAPGAAQTPKPTETAAEKPAESQKPAEGEATPGECPVLSAGGTIEAEELIDCAKEARAETAGYAVKNTVAGVESTMRVNPAEDAYALENELGSTIRIGNDGWVKPVGAEWVVSDPTSSDEAVAALSTAAAEISQADPTNRLTLAKGTLNIVGTQEMLGQQVFAITGRHEVEGTTVELSLQVTADYAVLGVAEATGDVTATTEVTEWNKKQDVQPPM